MFSISKPTVKQLCEFFKQIAEGKITGKVIQEVIERTSDVTLPQIFKKVLQQARETAVEIESLHLRVLALVAIAGFTHKAEDFKKARETADRIDDSHLKAQALGAIAEALAEAGDFKKARETADRIDDSHFKAQTLVVIAKALAETIK